jgi:hypothetical protein
MEETPVPIPWSDPSLVGVEQIPVPTTLTLEDLLNDQSLVLAKEQSDKSLLDTIGNQGIETLRPILLEWILKGRPPVFPILSLDIHPPTRCSDGEVRSLTDYIQFCSGKTINEHVNLLQAKLPDIRVTFANIYGKVTVIIITD